MIYLDNNATTNLAPEVFAAITPFLTKFYGNPAAAYRLGRESRRAIETAREQVAAALGATSAGEINFTSGGTEATNWAIFGALRLQPDKRKIIMTAVEHEVVARSCDHLEKQGYEIVRLAVDTNGNLNLDELRAAIDEQTALVSVMAANNETGVLFPIEKIGEIVKDRSDALFHVDGVQAVGKIPINLAAANVDFFAVAGHKFHAPKGTGALFVRAGIALAPMLFGGGQESKKRAGTENLSGIAGLGTACELVRNLGFNLEIERRRDRLETEILDKFTNARLNGDRANRLPNTTNISFAGISGEAILAHLDNHEICASTGSACNSDSHQSSPVLAAMNKPYREAMGAIRFSLSRFTTDAEIDETLRILPTIIDELEAMSPLL